MPKASLRVVDSERFSISGDLVFATVGRLLEEGKQHLATARQPVFDLAGVERCDSAGLALLIEWLDIAMARGVRPVFQNVPKALQGIAKLSNAESLISATGS